MASSEGSNSPASCCRAARLDPSDFVWAGATGLEPAASGVTGRRSNQLNYAPAQGIVEFIKRGWPFLTYGQTTSLTREPHDVTLIKAPPNRRDTKEMYDFERGSG